MTVYRSNDQPEGRIVPCPGEAHLPAPGGAPQGRGRRTENPEALLQRQSREIARLTQLLEAAGDPRAGLAREHELARMRAKLMDPATAAAGLAEQLTLAHCQAGKPSLTKLAEKVAYSKATLSKVFNNKMHPTWMLVRKLGIQLHVPHAIVKQDWHPLWMAADNYRRLRKSAGDDIEVTARATAPIPGTPDDANNGVDATGTGISNALTGPTGYSCPLCGSWVVETTKHADWHMQQNTDGQAAPEAESLGAGWNGESVELRLLHEAFSPDES